MALGDAPDMLRRLRAVLPLGWFPDTAPVLDAVLAGPAAAMSWVNSLIGYVYAQGRLATAVAENLDIYAQDFFGGRLGRKDGEADTAFRGRIRRELLREHATRAALVAALTDLTGQPPVIFEPGRSTDTGGWDTGAFAYDQAGAWGAPEMAYQALVTAYRPPVLGVPRVAGWDAGGWQAWCADEDVVSLVSDQDVRDCVLATIPAATVIWLSITNNPTNSPLLDDTFVLDESLMQ